MCGIVGIFDVRGRREVSRTVLSRMNDSQHHRGPDESALHLEPGIGLGHKRLSIIDIATGQQPLWNEDATVAVIFNGEIYNYQQLIPELTALGHVFRTRSDTEVIVHAWETWGAACVERFRGMFAFALWDRGMSTLFLARDRLGVKPLYYAFLPDGMFVFGSELKSLLAYPGFPRDIDVCAVEEYFALGYVPDPRTIFKHARKLPPAQTLSVVRGMPHTMPTTYWDPKFTGASPIAADDAVREVQAKVDESVRLRMIADVPIGAFLSGGVDSSAVVAAVASASTETVQTCSIAFADPAYDESRYARQVSERYRTRHHEKIADIDDFALIDTLVSLYDEPFADSSAIPTYRVCELARRHVTVALSGDGGDESFAGYGRYRRHLTEERMRRAIPQWLRRPVFGLLAGVYPHTHAMPRYLRARPTFDMLRRSAIESYMHEVSIFREDMRRRLFSDRLRAELGGYGAIEVFRKHAIDAQTDDALAVVQYLDLKTYLPGDINTKVDRASMAHSLEVREPLMDHPLVEWLATLPSSLKIRHGESKWLLKKAMEGRVPNEILYRRKMGFAVPLARWFRGPLAKRVRDAIPGERLADTGYFDMDYLRRLVDDHQSGRCDYSAALWSLLMFEAFLRKVVDEHSSMGCVSKAA